jgi:hypothetical protein
MLKVVKLIMFASLSVVVIGCSSPDKHATSSAITGSISSTTMTADINDVKPQACTRAWFTKIESQLITSDEQGHGPDLGSLEWRSVIEFKLGIRGDSSIPARNSALWCDYINTINRAR